MKGRSAPGIRTSLVVLVVGCVLPLALVAWFLIVNFYDRERSQLTTNAIGRARALTLVMDREIATTQAALQALGTSNFLVNGDLDGFRSRAIEVLRNLQAENIVVVDATGQFLVSTRRPFGEPLQSLTNPALLKLRRILQTGKPGISDLFYGPIAGQPIFAISVPVQILGSTGYSLSATVSTTYLSSMLVERQFPPNWRGSIFDSSGTIVARTHDIEKFRGKKINQDVPQRIGTSNEGSFESFTLEGVPALIAYSRSSATQWMAIIGIPLDELTAGLRKTLVSLIAATVTSLAVGLLLAWVIGGRIARSITALVKPATALGFGEMVPMPKLQFREANELRQALLDAAATLHRSETARKQAEEGLHKADTLRRSILYGSNFIIVATDTKGVIQLFNVGAERMLGYSAADVVDKVTPADISDPEEAVARAKTLSGEFATSIVPGFDAMTFKASRGIEDMYEMTYIRKDGNRLPAVMSVTALRDARDVIIGYMLTGTDNTARKDAEAAMRETDALLRTIHMHSIVSVTDRAGRIVDVNDSFCRISGYSRDELVGKTHRVVNSGVQTPEFWIDLWRNIASGKPWRGEICNRTKEGALYWVDSIIVPFLGEDGRTNKYISIRTDITKRKQYEESLREATHKAEQASDAKSEFLANMSHEIRTPMNAVIGLSYLLAQTSLDEQQSAFLAKVQIASKSLLVVLTNVLDLSKIEAGELIVERAVFGLRGLVQELADVMVVQAEARGIYFELDAPQELPRAVEGDAARLNQVLTNLLSNAVKFTERGGVTLCVRQLAVTTEGVRLSFKVRDTGIGIAPEEQVRLFAPFAQADASITRRFGGTGLGLSIVKRLVGLMGGEVSLDSTPGVGTEIEVVLEFAFASLDAFALLESPLAAPGARGLLGAGVLIVDDSDINLDVTKRILEMEGAQVWLASNGQEALEWLQAMPHAIDVVLMDVQMPVLDGYEAARRIRLQPGLADLPIIALTAGALSSERLRAAAAGMNDYIVKPFDPRAMVRSILRHVDPARIQLAQQIDTDLQPDEQVAAPWPEIEGIDSGDARQRLCDDFDLFRSMLKRLLDEFSDVAIPADADDPAALAVHGGRMHKLKGSAGTLGAKAIYLLAGEAEVACAAGEIRRAAHLASMLGPQLERLRQCAAPMFMAAMAEAEDAALLASGDLEPQVVADLVDLLRQQSLSATDRFTSISAQLQKMLSKDSYELVRDHMDNLQFIDAANALEASQR